MVAFVYHVLNRANGRLPISQKDGDDEAFERILAQAAYAQHALVHLRSRWNRRRDRVTDISCSFNIQRNIPVAYPSPQANSSPVGSTPQYTPASSHNTPPPSPVPQPPPPRSSPSTPQHSAD